MTDDKSLPGGQEKMLRAVERVIAAASSKSQNSVRITNLASGKIQVEIHAVGDDLAETGDRARAEFERQSSLASVPADELDHLRWLASIGQAAVENGWKPEGNKLPDETTAKMMEERDTFLADHQGEPMPKRQSVYAEGPEGDDLLAKLQAVVAAPAPDAEASDA